MGSTSVKHVEGKSCAEGAKYIWIRTIPIRNCAEGTKDFGSHFGKVLFIFPSFGMWMSSVGVNFECRCRAFFCLNVGCRVKNFGNVGCRNNPFHGP